MQPSDESHASAGASRFRNVFVASGHMTDAPDRVERGLGERFPERKVDEVRAAVAARLDAWGVDRGDLCICGGARGADIIFAETCAVRGADVWLFLALPVEEFVEKSVRSDGTDWERRFRDLRARESVKTFLLSDRPKAADEDEAESVFARNNLWMIEAAREEASAPEELHAILVWDERPTGDGPGGTSDFAARVTRAGGEIAIINPAKL